MNQMSEKLFEQKFHHMKLFFPLIHSTQRDSINNKNVLRSINKINRNSSRLNFRMEPELLKCPEPRQRLTSSQVHSGWERGKEGGNVLRHICQFEEYLWGFDKKWCMFSFKCTTSYLTYFPFASVLSLPERLKYFVPQSIFGSLINLFSAPCHSPKCFSIQYPELGKQHIYTFWHLMAFSSISLKLDVFSPLARCLPPHPHPHHSAILL